MQPYLFIGGNDDGLTNPAPDDAETLQWPSGPTGRETYHRSTLTVEDASVTIYIHESLTPAQVLERLMDFYKTWAKNRPGSRL